jgi:hypothetical protein
MTYALAAGQNHRSTTGMKREADGFDFHGGTDKIRREERTKRDRGAEGKIGIGRAWGTVAS